MMLGRNLSTKQALYGAMVISAGRSEVTKLTTTLDLRLPYILTCCTVIASVRFNNNNPTSSRHHHWRGEKLTLLPWP